MNRFEKRIIVLLKDDIEELGYFNYLRAKAKKYEKGYGILSEYWDSISEEEQPKVDKALKKVGL